ncbi:MULTISPECIES: tail fiber assembly protein [unclassified Pantoea]|uniref:Tail fiber assembly protein n=2 Tax=Erwiniaceae TaxID=1903409 RepID=A0AB34CCK0_9GAMM|nr:MULTISPECIES: tail fiber assembly protein [unclassified Pantoea]KAA5920922.1 tail fiber assembly protein [Pantoea sp. VH_8]KAA5927518.1 tail fiber assembly protein [Pantoea sp. VH_4]KAA5955499.1 tail fiber assembly protein [Pantoea sp. VH_24]KAA6007711.1 tail fiber assembly protein [Pantoea sp. F_5]KAA6010452.1 tail fiber assembly protein [Pantoea sp. F_15]KAA6019527.1 tail fiber assembly protein [Pantoea sp. F_17]KAA6031746.1 tail fiber assembly protein [Pantoea sp. F_14]KAA6100935.1 ta
MKNLHVYNAEMIAGNSVLFLKDDAGRDWYESQKLFDDETLKVVFDSSGIIVSMNYDVSTLWPVDNSVAEVAAADVPEGIDITGNWMFDGKNIVPRTYTAEEWQARAEAQRQNLLTAANAATADWRTELQLDTISDEDKASLVKWMAYIKALKAVDLSSVSDEAGYNAIVWPEEP